MEPTPSQVRNHYSQKNQEAHLERALTFKKATSLHCSSNVCLPIICLCQSCYGRLISPISSINQVEDSDQEIGDVESEATGESTISSDIEEHDVDHQQEVLRLRQACQDKWLRTTRVPLPKNWSHADTAIAHSVLPNSRNPPVTMAPPLLKCQKSTLLNILSESDHAHLPAHWCYSTGPVETRMLHNPRPAVIRTYPKTTRPLLRQRKGSWRQSCSQSILGQ